MKPAKYTDGRAYDGEKRYLGNGVTRSCGKCSQHKPTDSGFKLVRPWGLVCAQCRGEK